MSEREPGVAYTRRTVLGGTAAGAAVVAGCGAYRGRTNGADVLDVRMRDVRGADDGSLVVVVAVENPSEQTQTATLYVYVEIEDTSHRKAREVTVDPGATEAYTVPFEDLTYEQFTKHGSASPSLG